MKSALLLLLSTILTLAASSAESVRLNIDWPEFMTQHDPVWERLPENYFEGAFVGNTWPIRRARILAPPLMVNFSLMPTFPSTTQ